MNIRITGREVVLAALTACVAACAPDAMVNREATGYNAFLAQIASKCNPLMLGEHDVSTEIRYNRGINGDQYDYFVDVTSRLYYGQSSAASYRGAIQSFFGEDPRTNRGIDCIIANLPSTPPPMPAGPAKKIDQL